jgi:hypothetical protein
MTKRTDPTGQKQRQADLAPELHNDEQDDHRNQAQEVARQAKELEHNVAGPTESVKPASPGVDGVAGNETDLIDKMREMEKSGLIDNGAFAGEPNHDDNTGKFGTGKSGLGKFRTGKSGTGKSGAKRP